MTKKETEKILREIHEKFNDIDRLIEKYKKAKAQDCKEDKPQQEDDYLLSMGEERDLMREGWRDR